MNDHTLFEDLLRDFQDQKITLNTQMELVDPLAGKMRKPMAHRFFQTGSLLALEFLMWILVVACFGFLVFMNKFYPFYYLDQITNDSTVISKFQQHDLTILTWSVRGIVIFLGLVCFWTGRLLSKIRHKNSILNLAGKNLKLLMEQYFKRQREISILENKYPVALPPDSDSVIPSKVTGKPHDDILL